MSLPICGGWRPAFDRLRMMQYLSVLTSLFWAASAVRVAGFRMPAIAAEDRQRLAASGAQHRRPPPSQVTRLHRYDHSGLEVFLEREARWHAGHPTRVESAFLHLSEAQKKHLMDHHDEWMHMSANPANMSARRSRWIYRGAGDEFLPSQSGPASSLLQRGDNAKEDDITMPAGRSVTVLNSLMSQYVGEIGVGSEYAPENCKMPAAGSSLLHLEDAHLAAKANDTTCMAVDQAKVWVVFDTGSTNLWVASDLCKDSPCTNKGRVRYDHSRSKTYKDVNQNPAQLTVDFGTGRLIGHQGIDNFHIGPFPVYGQVFGLIEQMVGNVFQDIPTEGVLGLAFPSMSANGAVPFFDVIMKQGSTGQQALEHNLFAFYFSRDDPTANAIFWGNVDPDFYDGEVQRFPITDAYYWSVELDSFKIGNDCMKGPGCGVATQQANTNATEKGLKAIVDTGTTYFTAERDIFGDVIGRLPRVNCKSMDEQSHPPLVYTLRDTNGKLQEFKFTNDMYMTQSGSGDTAVCSPAFMQIDVPEKHGPAMVLGEVFLRYYIAIFDRGEKADSQATLGLATSKHEDATISRLRSLTGKQPSFQQSRQAE
eukprot:TRINITY_DN82185_c0_g1_i1.p1 TRINITY_DN82185_c0_g1~~TRINITY_DN82185_c0_g1_i1.p1  ORF type:complete len:604 (+),score=130.35 TRINITY_DN82185_c0_g1_i1:36-1814(+)